MALQIKPEPQDPPRPLYLGETSLSEREARAAVGCFRLRGFGRWTECPEFRWAVAEAVSAVLIYRDGERRRRGGEKA